MPAPELATEPAQINGPTIMLGSGVYFDYLRPWLTPPSPEDVAYGLGFCGRFAGQCVSSLTRQRVFYSVAQHCVIMSFHVPVEHAYPALMHELGEPTCVDVPGPLKVLCPEYKAVEKRCEAAAQAHYHSQPTDPALIKHWDNRMLATEQRDLMLHAQSHKWTFVNDAKPLPQVITPVGPYQAAEMFLARYRELRPPQAPEA